MAVQRGQVPGKTKVTVYIPDELAEALRIEAVLSRQRVSGLVEEAIRRELEHRRAEREGRSHAGT